MYLSTKIYIKPNQWDDKRKMVKNHPNADILNCMLYEYISTIEQTELGLWQQGKEISLSLLKDLIEKPVNNEKSFLDFYKEELATSSLKESTKHNHLSTLELLQAFKKRSSLQTSHLNLFPHSILICNLGDIILIRLPST